MNPIHFARAGALVAACAFALVAVPAAGAATTPSQLRVLTAAGKTLTDHVQYTGPTKVTASKKADCFGSPSSSDTYKLADANALGLLGDAERQRRSLRPVLITDAFFEDLGSMGICGIGGERAPFVSFDPENPQPTPYWYLAHNQVSASAGPNQLTLEAGDDVLYYLTKGTEASPPDQLELVAPERAHGSVFRVKVYAYSAGSGKRSPASGAEVGGRITDKAGRAKFEVSDEDVAKGKLVLQATRGDDVPSSREVVCLASECEPRGELIIGSPKADSIEGTKLADRIKPGGGKDAVDAGGGNDKVNAKGGGRDIVDCGAGAADRATVSAKDRVRNCEQVVRA